MKTILSLIFLCCLASNAAAASPEPYVLDHTEVLDIHSTALKRDYQLYVALGLQMLLTTPRSFEHYILGSPSLWYDHGVLFDREKNYATTHKDMPASVYFGIGGRETLASARKRSRSEEGADMVADLRDFDNALKSRRYPGLKTSLEVFAGEDHASVFPFLLTHGLRSYLGSAR